MMLDPTGGQRPNSPIGIQLNALSPDTLQFLGSQVGKVIEARVVEVIAKVAGNASSTLQNSEPKTPSALGNANRQNSNESYEVVLAVNKSNLKVAAPLAPRIGQILQLEVLSNQQLKIVDLGVGSTRYSSQQTAAGATASSQALTPPANTTANKVVNQTASIKPAPASAIGSIKVLQQALRSTLPRQTARTELQSGLTQLLSARNQSSSLPGLSASAHQSGAVSQSSAISQSGTVSSSSAVSQSGATSSTSSIGSTNTNSPSGITSRPPPAEQNTITHTARQASQQTQTIKSTTIQSPLPQPTLPATATQSISQLSDAIPNYQQLTTAAGVQTAILNNGIFFETKLAALAAQNRQQQTTNTATGQNPQHATGSGNNNATAVDQRTREALQSPNIQQDLKHRSLTVVQSIKNLLVPASLKAGKTADEMTKTSINQPVSTLWQLVNTHDQTARENRTSNETEVIMQLLRLALGNVARTQSQQLLALGSQFNAQNDVQPNQSLNFELPLWLDQRLNIIDVRIDHEKALKKSAHKIDSWNLRLRFDLEELGELTAMASLSGKRISAVFWASQTVLAQKIEAEIDTMKQNLNQLGLNVQQLFCRVGSPQDDERLDMVQLMETNLLNTHS